MNFKKRCSSYHALVHGVKKSKKGGRIAQLPPRSTITIARLESTRHRVLLLLITILILIGASINEKIKEVTTLNGKPM